MDEFDNEVFNQATSKRGVEESNILQYIMSGAWFHSEDQIELGMRDSNKCNLCGETEEDIIHSLWDCKKLHGEGMCSKLKGPSGVGTASSDL